MGPRRRSRFEAACSEARLERRQLQARRRNTIDATDRLLEARVGQPERERERGDDQHDRRAGAAHQRVQRPPDICTDDPAALRTARAERRIDIKKYASALLPSAAIMRGTLISRKTMPPISATSTGKSGAALQRVAQPAAVQPPMVPACAETPGRCRRRTARAIAAIPTISRLSRPLAVALRAACVPWKLSLLRHSGSSFCRPYARRPRRRPDRTGIAARSAARARPAVTGLELRFERYDLSLDEPPRDEQRASCTKPPPRYKRTGSD